MPEETFGAALGRLRRSHEPPLSLRALARLVNYSHVYLWQVETGRSRVTADLATRCDAALDAAGELIAIAERELARRAWEDSLSSYDSDLNVGENEVRALRDARNRYEAFYRNFGGVAARPRILEFLREQAYPMLRGRFDERISSQLFRAVGGLVSLAGVCAYDARELDAAHQHYRYALRLAKASEDPEFVAYVVSLLATLALRTGDPRGALAYVDRGLREPQALSPAILADLYCLRAEASAYLRDTACERHMHNAYQAAERIELSQEPPEARYVQPGLLEGRHAEILRILGRSRSAEMYARQSLTSGVYTHPRGIANRLVVMSRVLLANGKLDEAASTANQILDLACDMESRLFRDRIRSLADAIQDQATKSDAVGEFRARASELLSSRL